MDADNGPDPRQDPGPLEGASADDLFRAVLTHSAVGTALVAPDGGFLVVNAALCTMLDRTESELTACTWQELTHPEDLAIDLALVSDVLAGQRDA